MEALKVLHGHFSAQRAANSNDECGDSDTPASGALGVRTQVATRMGVAPPRAEVLGKKWGEKQLAQASPSIASSLPASRQVGFLLYMQKHILDSEYIDGLVNDCSPDSGKNGGKTCNWVLHYFRALVKHGCIRVPLRRYRLTPTWNQAFTDPFKRFSASFDNSFLSILAVVPTLRLISDHRMTFLVSLPAKPQREDRISLTQTPLPLPSPCSFPIADTLAPSQSKQAFLLASAGGSHSGMRLASR
ncbi:hypothetical protein MIND_01419600 [Mycena indigotica]|uniref:Uncharacterized protein n=1 Tax=Mycena indigotica TaxID=2126181 RepID=A0A8H6VUJ0_9AGAR|nr:uncharacterized protein MIND_01419600 [Mycena indigotica]KAF7288744.1 hypothetical protein MIND_01419600 [Mycena indigotica]